MAGSTGLHPSPEQTAVFRWSGFGIDGVRCMSLPRVSLVSMRVGDPALNSMAYLVNYG